MDKKIAKAQAAGNAAHAAALLEGLEAAYDAYREAAGLAFYPTSESDYLDAVERAVPHYGVGRQRWSGICGQPNLTLVKATPEMGLPSYIGYVLAMMADVVPMAPDYEALAREEPVSQTVDSRDAAAF